MQLPNLSSRHAIFLPVTMRDAPNDSLLFVFSADMTQSGKENYTKIPAATNLERE